MTEENTNPESKGKCPPNRCGSGCSCFKLAVGVILLLIGFWVGRTTSRCGMGMKCGIGRRGMVAPCPMAQNAPVTPNQSQQ